MFLHKMGWLFQQVLYPSLTWSRYGAEKVIYLTFDDGPIPELTDWVLEILAEYDAKGTFFCVGDNIRKYPEIFQRVLADGHSVGNHTFNHLNGWKTENADYFSNVSDCAQMLESTQSEEKKPLFRPPYGRIRQSQIRQLKPDYEIIMWDVLSGDFSGSISPETCLQKSIRHTQAGSIIVFHDNLKANRNLQYTLPRYLAHFSAQGFVFRGL